MTRCRVSVCFGCTCTETTPLVKCCSCKELTCQPEKCIECKQIACHTIMLFALCNIRTRGHSHKRMPIPQLPTELVRIIYTILKAAKYTAVNFQKCATPTTLISANYGQVMLNIPRPLAFTPMFYILEYTHPNTPLKQVNKDCTHPNMISIDFYGNVKTHNRHHHHHLHLK